MIEELVKVLIFDKMASFFVKKFTPQSEIEIIIKKLMPLIVKVMLRKF